MKFEKDKQYIVTSGEDKDKIFVAKESGEFNVNQAIKVINEYGVHGELFIASNITEYKEKVNNKLLWAKVKPEAIIPTKRDEDAGYDIYPCFDENYIVIPPHETKMIPTGIASAFSDEYVAVLKERGSTGTKGIAQRCGIIDSGFRNEWLCPITNTTEEYLILSKLTLEELIEKHTFNYVERYEILDTDDGSEICLKDYQDDEYTEAIIYPYSKAICQALILPVPKMDSKEVTYDELKSITSERGMGMLGSSQK